MPGQRKGSKALEGGLCCLCLVPLMLWMKSAPQRLLDESVLKLKKAVKAIGWDRFLQHCLRVTPTRLCNHNNHNNVTSTRNWGQEKQQHPPDSDKGSRRVKCSDVQTGCSTTIITAGVCHQVKASMLCFMPQTPHTDWVSPGYRYNSCTVSTSPSSSCFSVMEPVAFMACRLSVCVEHTSTARWPQPSMIFPYAVTLFKGFNGVLALWAVNAGSKTPGNNVSPNSQINRIHSLCGISYWMAGCCTSLSAFGRAAGE